jgi:hypothetical protein
MVLAAATVTQYPDMAKKPMSSLRFDNRKKSGRSTRKVFPRKASIRAPRVTIPSRGAASDTLTLGAA